MSSPVEPTIAEHPDSSRRLGRLAGWAVVTLSLLYLATGIAGLVFGRIQTAENLGQGEPYLSLLEALIVALAPFLILLFVAAHAAAPEDKKPQAIAALCFAALAAGLTASIHFARLVIVRRLDPATVESLSPLVSFRWPSVALALDLLAWDLCLGIALLFLSSAWRAERSIRLTSAAAGWLCLLGFLGPATGEMQIQFLGIAGYAFLFPLAAWRLALFFGRRNQVS